MFALSLAQTKRGTRVGWDANVPKRLRGLVKLALQQALSEYCTGKLRPASLRDRFGTKAMTLYGFTPRSAGYRRRQSRDPLLGGPAAFVSPRIINWAKIARQLQSVAKAEGGQVLAATAAALGANPSRPHLRDTILRPGTGHQVAVRGARKIVATVTFPAARALNANPQYAEELRDLTLGGARDWRAIVTRARQIFNQLMTSRRTVAA